MTTLNILSIVVILALMGALAYLINRLILVERKKSQMDLKFREMEFKLQNLQLESIEAKLNPHLFKNILNSIQSHAYQTYYTIDKLSSVLDYVLYDSQQKYVTPKAEIEFALNLIEINKIKTNPIFDLRIKTKVSSSELLYEQKLMAPLVTIDLIENAFKHADFNSPDSFISISFELKDNIFSMTVANKISSKPAIKKENGGLGLNLLKQRLGIIYDKNFKLDSFIEDEIYISHLKIDLFEQKVKLLAVR